MRGRHVMVSTALVEVAETLGPGGDQLGCFSPSELATVGAGGDRLARLAARLVAKQACLVLVGEALSADPFSLGDLVINNDAYGAPCVMVSGRLRLALGDATLGVSLTHTSVSAAAVVWIEVH